MGNGHVMSWYRNGSMHGAVCNGSIRGDMAARARSDSAMERQLAFNLVNISYHTHVSIGRDSHNSLVKILVEAALICL